jgi:hypothetical protein
VSDLCESFTGAANLVLLGEAFPQLGLPMQTISIGVSIIPYDHAIRLLGLFS